MGLIMIAMGAAMRGWWTSLWHAVLACVHHMGFGVASTASSKIPVCQACLDPKFVTVRITTAMECRITVSNQDRRSVVAVPVLLSVC